MKRDKGKGYALIFVLLMVALILLSITAVSFITFSDLNMAKTASINMKAYYIAEAGLAKKFMDLRGSLTSSINPPGQNFTLNTAGTDFGTYVVNVTPMAAGNFLKYQLDATGTYKNVKRTVSLIVQQSAISRFAYMSDQETYGGNPIWFLSRDTIHGPLYTNGQIHVSGNPTFDGPVSSVSSSIAYYNGPPPQDNPNFLQSLTLGAAPIAMPTASDMLTGTTGIQHYAGLSGGLSLTGNTTINFLSNGTMDVTNKDAGWNNAKNKPIPADGAIYVNNTGSHSGTVNISGTLKGNVSIGASGDIYIVNNIKYNTNPVTNPASTDMLGIVAGNNVYVDQNAPSDLEIDADIVALNTSFAVVGYDGAMKGTLTLLGGVTQENRGAVGTFNSSTNTKTSGYTKNYNYDTRLLTAAPMYFPAAKDANGRLIYRKVSWFES